VRPRRELLKNEIRILNDIAHGNILEIYELLHDAHSYYIVSEYIEGGQLFDYIQKCARSGHSQEVSSDTNSSNYLGRFSEAEVRFIAAQLFGALSYLHQKGIVHRDVKLENILVKSSHYGMLKIKLIDFGFATYCDNRIDDNDRTNESNSKHKKSASTPATSAKLSEVLGSPLYMAPEIVLKQTYDQKVDVWSAGVVIYSLLCGRMPFFGSQREEVYQSICKDKVRLDSPRCQRLSNEVKDFVKLALSKDQSNRPSSEQLRQHPWLTTKK